ncbi:calpain-5 isoform X1 [Hydra vulgaris]|uniref:calpain-5 isoform X1 n=1 Tax=Hydra vulgaris TaxID=6087 RepID=UPI001F5E3F48|nr:calpain-5 isoform X1 [Hydra vulgaris]XP_047129852.1 calpain-5 isoform X1 [Hydra vulgaris]XP_047129853.1 calpain-5 isoform X1 [Hydra vulgaris]
MKYSFYKNQQFELIIKQCISKKKLFEDPEFPASDTSLFFSKHHTFTAVWKRPGEICDDPQMFVDGASSADVTQGRVGNCWFVAAAASLALEKDLYTKVIPHHRTLSFQKEYYHGIFRFRFWRFGEWIEVVIDDRLPTINGELIYVKSKTKNEFWSALLEKAYAKLSGSYEALESGNPGDALVDFTGGVSERIDLVEGDYHNNLEKKKLLHVKLSKLMSRKSMISASIQVQNRDEMELQMDHGLVKGHAYSILAVKKIKIGNDHISIFNANRLFMVKLRNPWGDTEWNGPWSDGSPQWNLLSAQEREKYGLVNENSGEFWMSFGDFCKYFTTVTVCILVNTSVISFNKTYHEGSVKSKWEGKSAGGCITNKETFLNNPQFCFDMTSASKDEVFISLMQPDTRSKRVSGKGENLTIGIMLFKVEANRIYRLHQYYDQAGDSHFSNAREIFVRFDLDPGRYVMIPSTFEPGIFGYFLLRVYTDQNNAFRQLTEDAPKPGCCPFLPWCAPPHIQVSIIIKSVNNLKNIGATSLNPYCIIECNGLTLYTPIVYDSLNPTFDYGGLFYLSKQVKPMLKIQVWGSNTLIPDMFLGEIISTIVVKDKTVLEMHTLMERSHGGRVSRANGTISFKITASNKLTFM